MRWLDDVEIEKFGFAHVGANVMIDSTTNVAGARNISIGDNVRIDAGATLIAGISHLKIGSHVHISPNVYVSASNADVILSDFSALSVGVSVFSATDTYTGDFLTNPTVPDQFRQVKAAPVVVGDFVVVGAHSVILPGVTLYQGCAIGALTLVSRDVQPGNVVVGNPHRVVGHRDLEELRRHALALTRTL